MMEILMRMAKPQLETNLIGTFWNFFTQNYDKRKLVIYGGAGSGKSVSTAQWIVKLFLEKDDKVFLIVRNTFPALKITCFILITQLLAEVTEKTGLEFKINYSELTIRHPDNKNVMFFKSIDDEEKIKSFETNYIWIEEATEITYEKYLQLNLRLRRNSDSFNQMFMTFNPISIHHWLYKKIVSQPSVDTAIHHSTWEDNPFLPKEYIEQLASLASEDENYFNIYTKGNWGQVGNLVYTNYLIENSKDWGFEPDNVFYGIDFGYNVETAVVKVMEFDKKFYCQEKLYQTKLTNKDLVKKLGSIIDDKKHFVYADSAEPSRIDEIRESGYICFPAEKNVKDGIDFVKRHKLHLDIESVNLIEEIQNYSYRKDKDGNFLEEPIKFHDHLCDALRYALYSNYVRMGSHKPSSGVVFY